MIGIERTAVILGHIQLAAKALLRRDACNAVVQKKEEEVYEKNRQQPNHLQEKVVDNTAQCLTLQLPTLPIGDCQLSGKAVWVLCLIIPS